MAPMLESNREDVVSECCWIRKKKQKSGKKQHSLLLLQVNKHSTFFQNTFLLLLIQESRVVCKHIRSRMVWFPSFFEITMVESIRCFITSKVSHILCSLFVFQLADTSTFWSKDFDLIREVNQMLNG